MVPDKLHRSFKCVHSSGQPQSSLEVGLQAVAWPREIRVTNMGGHHGRKIAQTQQGKQRAKRLWYACVVLKCRGSDPYELDILLSKALRK